jgi:hypothetical protein
MRCPVEGCPKVITGFLYHLNSHLNAHKRQLQPSEKLRVRTSPLMMTTTASAVSSTVPSRLTRGSAAINAAVNQEGDDDVGEIATLDVPSVTSPHTSTTTMPPTSTTTTAPPLDTSSQASPATLSVNAHAMPVSKKAPKRKAIDDGREASESMSATGA